MTYRQFIACFSLSWALLAAANLPLSKIQWVECSKNVPDTLSALGASGLNLSSLPSTLHCGRIEVPMDYAKPISPCNKITLGLAMYRPAKPKGVLFYNPGGTDPAAVFAWLAALNVTSGFYPDFSGLLDFDLMMMDVRGTWSSSLLNVDLATVNPVLGAYPTTQSEFDALHTASAKMFSSWIDSSTPTGIIQHVGTREVTQDYESIRKALGYDKIHFLGTSYGSFRAAQYAATFPHNVGHFVLDAVAPHGLGFFDQANDDMVAVNRALLRADAYCQNNARCPFHSQGKGSIPKAYRKLLAAAQKSPLVAPASCKKSRTCYPPVTPSDVQQGMYNLLAGQPNFPFLFDALWLALAGNATGFVAPPISVAGVVGLPLECGDDYIEDNSFSGFQKSFQAASKLDTNEIGRTLNWELRLACTAWPFDTAPTVPLNLEAPMLLVTADFEIDTPTEKASFAWKYAPNSALVVRHGDDHVSFNLPDQPSTAITKEFLRTGVLPAPREEKFVSVYTPGMKRAPIPSPYDVPTGFAAGDCTGDCYD